MIVCDVATKMLDTELFPQHTFADLNLRYTICFAHSGEALTVKEINTQAHTHTHTHTRN